MTRASIGLFFAALKAGTAGSGGLDRLFMTGVSPITLDDMTSGFKHRHEYQSVGSLP